MKEKEGVQTTRRQAPSPPPSQAPPQYSSTVLHPTPSQRTKPLSGTCRRPLRSTPNQLTKPRSGNCYVYVFALRLCFLRSSGGCSRPWGSRCTCLTSASLTWRVDIHVPPLHVHTSASVGIERSNVKRKTRGVKNRFRSDGPPFRFFHRRCCCCCLVETRN